MVFVQVGLLSVDDATCVEVVTGGNEMEIAREKAKTLLLDWMQDGDTCELLIRCSAYEMWGVVSQGEATDNIVVLRQK